MAFNFLERKSRITSDTLKTFNETRESHHYIEYKDKSGLLKPDTIEWVKSYPKWWYNRSTKHFNYAAPLSPTTLEMPSGHKDKNAGGMELGPGQNLLCGGEGRVLRPHLHFSLSTNISGKETRTEEKYSSSSQIPHISLSEQGSRGHLISIEKVQVMQPMPHHPN